MASSFRTRLVTGHQSDKKPKMLNWRRCCFKVVVLGATKRSDSRKKKPQAWGNRAGGGPYCLACRPACYTKFNRSQNTCEDPDVVRAGVELRLRGARAFPPREEEGEEEEEDRERELV